MRQYRHQSKAKSMAIPQKQNIWRTCSIKYAIGQNSAASELKLKKENEQET